MNYLSTNPFKRIAFSAAKQLKVNWLKKHTPINFLIPYYHLVSDDPVPYIDILYHFKNTRQFENDLDYLLKNFNPVSLTDLIEHIKGTKPIIKKSFLLTFDDGLRQVYEIIAPVLLRKGVPCALFINPAFIDNKEIFYDLKKGLILQKLNEVPGNTFLLKTASEIFKIKIVTVAQLKLAVRLIHYHNRDMLNTLGELLELDFEKFRKIEQPFMSTEEVQNLVNKGFNVGAHSMDHPLYNSISLCEQIQQTEQSVEWVCTTFKLPYKTFAFPHADTGVSQAFFNHFSLSGKYPLDLILGNTTGMLEKQPNVFHRFIGENPAVSANSITKSLMAYAIINKILNRSYVKRYGC